MRLTTLKSPLQRLTSRVQSSPSADRLRGRAAVERRQRIMVRDLSTCRECGRTTLHGEVDHIAPLHLGGHDTDANLAWLCIDCHKAKSAREAKNRG